MAIERSRGGRLAAVLAGVLVAGCGGAGAPTAGPTVMPSGATTASAGPSATASSTPAATPAASPAPALQLLWEAAGDTPPSGSDPDTYWPTIDPVTGDIWVALSFDSRYWIFSPDGKYLGSFGEPGTGPGQFNLTRPATCGDCGAGAIAFAPDGSFYVADDGNNRIQQFDAKHHFVRAWGSFGSGDGQFADASTIVTDGKSVYVYDDQRTDIQVFDASGHFLRKFTGAGWLTMDKAGHLFGYGNGTIDEYDPAGKMMSSVPLPSLDGVSGDFIGLAVDGQGRFYWNLQDPDRPNAALGLVRFDPATKTAERWSTGGETLTVDPSGQAIYLANFVSPGWPKPVLRKYALPAAP